MFFEVKAVDAVDNISDSVSWTTKMVQDLATKAIDVSTKYGVRIILTIIFIIIGFKLSKMVIKLLKRSLEKHGVDQSVTGFLASFSDIVIKIVILLTAANGLGIAITSFLTVLGSASIALGLALQGSLANLAGGVLILILKPYRVGDYIKAGNGVEGTVSSIDIFYTKLNSVDNQTIVVPNGSLSNSSITNVTKADHRRVDLEVGVAYDADIKKAKTILTELLNEEKRILTDMGQDVFVSSLGESSVVLGIHAWVKTADYWSVRWDTLEKIKYRFDENNIEIPFNTLNVNVSGNEK